MTHTYGWVGVIFDQTKRRLRRRLRGNIPPVLVEHRSCSWELHIASPLPVVNIDTD